MNKYWFYVLLAATFEVFWVAGLKHSESTIEWAMTIIAIIATFFLLPITAKYLPIGTVYAVFAGLGTVGTVLVEMIIYGEAFHLVKIILIGTLLIGVIGLKVVSSEPQESKGVV
ncbi:DMT family transporter [Aquibacillus rhizosphaerae]|uniref:Multidrug efflux SMR transporter n=1 Tax=Aquibacillus rhizosphaerae TaxID=3051431 RepID=A0ABT7LA90_9BACI|nr:multidrug efflux SMR transporter [Aquibacillus sp. LR5S19]MDL4842314.1 multidrug efflux SMR transporter [Aquibacillus sp. LR5S19]